MNEYQVRYKWQEDELIIADALSIEAGYAVFYNWKRENKPNDDLMIPLDQIERLLHL